MSICKHTNHTKWGKDRHGNQRYKCLDCNATWTDKRRDNRVDKSIFVYTKDMLLDWVDGHSYKTLSRNYHLSLYYVHLLINWILLYLPDFREMIVNHEDCDKVEYIGIDGGYVRTSKGQVCFLIAVDIDTNTICHFKMVKDETQNEIFNFIIEIYHKFYYLKGITSDLKSSYGLAIEQFLHDFQVNITHEYCRVHLYMAYRNKSHGLSISFSKNRKYNTSQVLLDWEKAFHKLCFHTNTTEEYYKNMDEIKALPVPSDKYKKALIFFDKNHKSYVTKNTPYRYHTNNLTESWWNLLKTKFKTARSLGYDTIEKWMNLFVLRYHFNHLNFDGSRAETQRRFNFFELSCFEYVINSIETTFSDYLKQHNFKRS